MALTSYLEKKGERTLTIHPDDEFDPINRLGLLSLKVLAKGAGLGWQGPLPQARVMASVGLFCMDLPCPSSWESLLLL